MPVLYHGTSDAFAATMATGTIDVSRGRGEFGRGFYTQDSGTNAARRGQAIYGNSSSVLVLTIDDQAYYALNLKRLTLDGAQTLNARLRTSKRQHRYTTTHDAIVGPLVSRPRVEQQKFQTALAETLLNGPLTQRAVR